MVVFKRKKSSRQRGSKTHGWGAMKKHRGSGNRGGCGHAGTGKRSDHTKPSINPSEYFGKYGFKSINHSIIHSVNLAYFEEKLPHLLQKGLVAQEKGIYVVDCKKLGFDKVLCKGSLTKKLKISASLFSKNAVEKIKKAGGEAIITGAEAKKEAKKEEPKNASKASEKVPVSKDKAVKENKK